MLTVKYKKYLKKGCDFAHWVDGIVLLLSGCHDKSIHLKKNSVRT